ncbi:MAG TPA: DUF2203 domain-containing protein [Actinomycetota bacterium]|nr:DUF2203 domain-containing protein [Actinomycetota bacterium]
MTERRFTVEEANAELPALREILPAIQAARAGLIDASARITDAVASDGGGVAGSDWFAHQQALRDGLEELARRGIVLRDTQTGLVDFPAEHDGEPVYLCWRMGEGDVGYYHGEHGGYRSRRPL